MFLLSIPILFDRVLHTLYYDKPHISCTVGSVVMHFQCPSSSAQHAINPRAEEKGQGNMEEKTQSPYPVWAYLAGLAMNCEARLLDVVLNERKALYSPDDQGNRSAV